MDWLPLIVRLVLLVLGGCYLLALLALLLGRVLPDGQQIAYFAQTSYADFDLRLLDLDRRLDIALLNDPLQPDTLRWSPDGERLGFIANRSGIPVLTLMDMRSGTLYNVESTAYPHAIRTFVWSADNIHILLLLSVSGGLNRTTLRVLDTRDDSGVDLLTGDITAADWSPDSTQVAYLEMTRSATGSRADLNLLTLADGSIRTLLTTDGTQGEVHWSPDGRLIAYSTNNRDYGRLFAYDLRRASTFPLTPENLIAFGFRWSPDSTRGVFTGTTAGDDNEVYLAYADGTEARWLTQNWYLDTTPVWSPDGSRIAFVSNNRLFVMLADDRDSLRRVTVAGRRALEPAWRP